MKQSPETPTSKQAPIPTKRGATEMEHNRYTIALPSLRIKSATLCMSSVLHATYASGLKAKECPKPVKIRICPSFYGELGAWNHVLLLERVSNESYLTRLGGVQMMANMGFGR